MCGCVCVCVMCAGPARSLFSLSFSYLLNIVICFLPAFSQSAWRSRSYSLLVLLQELLVEGLEQAEHFLQLFRLGQDGGAEMVGTGALPEAGTGHDADTCCGRDCQKVAC